MCNPRYHIASRDARQTLYRDSRSKLMLSKSRAVKTGISEYNQRYYRMIITDKFRSAWWLRSWNLTFSFGVDEIVKEIDWIS